MDFIGRIVSKIKGYMSDEIPAELMEEEPDFPEESNVIISQGNEDSEIFDEEKTTIDEADAVKSFDREMPENAEMSFEEYTHLFRKKFRAHFPEALDTIDRHMQLPFMIGEAVDISPVIKYAVTGVYSRFKTEPEKWRPSTKD